MDAERVCGLETGLAEPLERAILSMLLMLLGCSITFLCLMNTFQIRLSV